MWWRSSKANASPDNADNMEVRVSYLPIETRELLRQVVHPLFADMPQPQVQLSNDPAVSKLYSAPEVDDADAAVMELAAKMAEELRHPQDVIAEVTASAQHAPEIFWAAMSVAMQTVGLDSAPHLRLLVGSNVDQGALITCWSEFQREASMDVILAPEWGALPEKDSYSWIRQDSAPSDSLTRLAAAFASLRRASQLSSVTDMIDGTKLLLPSPPRPTWPNKRMTKVWHSCDSVLDTAAKRARQGFRVVAVNSGSAYQVGGAFLTGGPHALEEAMCTQSSVFLSLQQAQRLAYDFNLLDAKGQPVHIPETGAVLSPNVEIFRQGVSHGYAPCEEGPVVLAGVVTVAMPNLNPKVLHNPVEWRTRPQREQLIEKKMNAMVQGAEMVDADVLVVSDIGCGKFGNDPRLIGAALGIVLSRYPGHFQEIIITGGVRFFDAVCEAVGPGFVVSHKEPQHRPEDALSTVSTRTGSTETDSPSIWSFAKNMLSPTKDTQGTIDSQATMPRRGTGAEALVIGRQDTQMSKVDTSYPVKMVQASPVPPMPRMGSNRVAPGQGSISSNNKASLSSEPRIASMSASDASRRSGSVPRRAA